MSSSLESLKSKYYSQYKEELFNYCIPFWLKHGFDKENGGVINCLDREGNEFSTDKSVWMQGRCAWMFSHLSNMFGENKEYLTFAKSCIEFADKHCFDKDGRMYFKVTKDGKPLRKRRYWFSESFYIIACAEYYMATKENEYLIKAKKVYDLIYNIYINPSSDPFKIYPKVIPETRQMKSLAEPMILLNVSSIMRKADEERKEIYNKNIEHCLKEIKYHFFENKNCLLENIGINNEYISDTSDGRIINPGHDLECALFLVQEAIYKNNDSSLINLAEKIFYNAINIGWDSKYGGIVYFKDAEDKPVEAYEHDMKLWWPHNEGIVASLLLFKITGKQKYADWFEKLTKYSFEHFSDREFGEWYGYLRRDGQPTEPPCKGCTYKGPFHVLRCLASVIQIFDGKDF